MTKEKIETVINARAFFKKYGDIDAIKAVKMADFDETFGKFLADAKKHTQKTFVLWQELAVVCLIHLQEHRNINVVRHFLEKHFPDGLYKGTMIAYFEKVGAVTVNYDEENDDMTIDYDRVKHGKFVLADAMNTPWWKVKKETIVKPLVFADDLETVIKKADARLKDDKGVQNDIEVNRVASVKEIQRMQEVSDTFLAELNALVNKHKGLDAVEEAA